MFFKQPKSFLSFKTMLNFINTHSIISTIKKYFSISLGLFALWSLKSIFENDNSKIISKNGKSYLHDEKKMKEVYEKIKESEEKGSRYSNEVIL